jgi:hypothetical protein
LSNHRHWFGAELAAFQSKMLIAGFVLAAERSAALAIA